MEVPNITRKEFSIMSIDGEGYATLMDTGTSELRTDIRLPDDTDEDVDLSKKLKEAVEEGKNILVTVLAAMNIEKIVEFKEA